MDRTCDHCGETYAAKRATSKFCSTRCRTRACRDGSARAAPVVRLPAAGGEELGPVAAAARAELAAAGRVETTLGRTALVMAAKLDGARDGGMGMATLARQLGLTMAEALRGAASAADRVDELRDRRDRKRSAG